MFLLADFFMPVDVVLKQTADSPEANFPISRVKRVKQVQ